MKVSVIIPALNEAANVEASVASAMESAFEVIVADGASADSTAAVAAGLGAIVVKTASGRPGRGAPMDEAALKARGGVLLFLHADTRLPAGWLALVEEALSDDRVVAGAFRLSVEAAGLRFRFLEAVALLRARLFKLIYGDQALFVRREAFFKAGGFRKLPLMEDVDCVKRLRKAGRVVIVEGSIVTSARRWERKGIAANAARNLILVFLYKLGVAPDRLYSLYYGGAPSGKGG